MAMFSPFPKMDISYGDRGFGISTTLRKQHGSVWYRWNFYRDFEWNNKYTKHAQVSDSMNHMLHEIYMTMFFGIIDPDIIDQRGNKVFTIDEDQRSEEQRMLETIPEQLRTPNQIKMSEERNTTLDALENKSIELIIKSDGATKESLSKVIDAVKAIEDDGDLTGFFVIEATDGMPVPADIREEIQKYIETKQIPEHAESLLPDFNTIKFDTTAMQKSVENEIDDMCDNAIDQYAEYLEAQESVIGLLTDYIERMRIRKNSIQMSLDAPDCETVIVMNHEEPLLKMLFSDENIDNLNLLIDTDLPADICAEAFHKSLMLEYANL